MAAPRSRSVKIGIFVFTGFVIATIAVFLIGDNRRQWDRKITYHAKFANVAGLRQGASVRMAGLDVGSVSKIGYDSDKDTELDIAMEVARKEAGRVLLGSKVVITGRGLLGDKMVEIIPPDPKLEAEDLAKIPNWDKQAPEGAVLRAPDMPGDLGTVVAKADAIATKAQITIDNVNRASERLADPKVAEDLAESARSLREILDGIAHKDGVAHKLVFDPETAKKLDRISANLDTASANLAQVSGDARDVADHVKSGPGLAHTVVYDEGTAQSVSGSLAELNGSLKAIRTGNGLAHGIIYGDDANTSQHVMGNLSAMSDDLREIVANMKAGRGTIGALLVDPSVYEDLKQLVGNVERNQVLRALVRYSIKQNESEKPHAEVKDGASR